MAECRARKRAGERVTHEHSAPGGRGVPLDVGAGRPGISPTTAAAPLLEVMIHVDTVDGDRAARDGDAVPTDGGGARPRVARADARGTGASQSAGQSAGGAVGLVWPAFERCARCGRPGRRAAPDVLRPDAG